MSTTQTAQATRRCPRCRVTKSTSEFGYRSKEHKQFSPWCKRCVADYAQERRRARPAPRKTRLSGSGHPGWKGRDVGYFGMHDRVRFWRGKADHCIHRAAIGCTSQRFQWAHIHDSEPTDIYNYVAMCVTCHRGYDAPMRLAALPRGEAHSSAKLTAALVVEIRGRVANGEKQVSLAREFGVDDSTICNIVKRKIWKHVA